MPVSLRHAILGLLSVEPMTGYDLKHQCFDGSIGHFWPADQSQIYRTLEALVLAGWAVPEPQPGDQGPARKVYHITPLGEQELDRWLRTPPAVPAARDASLIQVFFSDRLPNDAVRAKLEAIRDAYAQRLAVYEAIPLPPLEADVPTAVRRQRMTLELGLAHARAGVAWAEQCLRFV